MRPAGQRPVPNGAAGTTLEILIALTLVGTAVLTVAVLGGKRPRGDKKRDEDDD